MKESGKSPVLYSLSGVGFSSCPGHFDTRIRRLGLLSEAAVSIITAVAAGSILTMLTQTMIPEAYEDSPDFADIITVAGFLTEFAKRDEKLRET